MVTERIEETYNELSYLYFVAWIEGETDIYIIMLTGGIEEMYEES